MTGSGVTRRRIGLLREPMRPSQAEAARALRCVLTCEKTHAWPSGETILTLIDVRVLTLLTFERQETDRFR